MRYFILYLLFSFSLISCNTKQETNDNDLSKVKSLIISEYSKYDAQYFSNKQKCLFENFVNEGINNLEFDHIVEGISIKYFNCQFIRFQFVVLKCNNIFYYYGLSDAYAYLDLLKRKYEEVNETYISRTDSLELIKDINNRGITLLTEIINNHEQLKRFYVKEGDPKFGVELQKIFAIIYYINHFNSSTSGLIYIPIYTDVSSRFKEELLNLKCTPNKNDKIYRKIVEEYDKMTGLINVSKHTYFLKLKNLGIFIYDIVYENEKIKIERQFVPEKKIYKITSGYDIPTGYGDCYE